MGLVCLGLRAVHEGALKSLWINSILWRKPALWIGPCSLDRALWIEWILTLAPKLRGTHSISWSALLGHSAQKVSGTQAVHDREHGGLGDCTGRADGVPLPHRKWFLHLTSVPHKWLSSLISSFIHLTAHNEHPHVAAPGGPVFPGLTSQGQSFVSETRWTAGAGHEQTSELTS